MQIKVIAFQRINKWVIDNINKNNNGFFIDITKVFDTVDQDSLLDKLEDPEVTEVKSQ